MEDRKGLSRRRFLALAAGTAAASQLPLPALPVGRGARAVAAAGNPFPGLTHPPIPAIEALDPRTPLRPELWERPPRWAMPQAYYTPAGAMGPKSPEGSFEAHAEAEMDRLAAAGVAGAVLELGGPTAGSDFAGPWIEIGRLGGTDALNDWSWLGDGYFEMFEALTRAAARRGLDVIVLDTNWTPSGGAAGRVAEPAHGGDPAFGLCQAHVTVPATAATPGRWTIEQRPYWTDVLNPVAVRRLIDLVYEPHVARVQDLAGSTFIGFFTDEVAFAPQTHTIASPPPFILPFSPTLPAYFEQVKGYPLLDEPLQLGIPLASKVLDGVFRPESPEERRRAYDFWDVVSRRFAESYYRQLSQWSADHGLGQINQLFDEEKVNNHFRAEGSYFRCAATATIASCDMISNTLDTSWGGGTDTPNAGAGTTTRMISSAAHLFQIPRVHTEIFAADDVELCLPPRMLKARYDRHLARGMNWFAPRPYGNNGDDSYGAKSSTYSDQPHLNSYVGRVSYALTGGHTVPEVALLYPVENAWVGAELSERLLNHVSDILTADFREFDIVPPELLDDGVTVVAGGAVRRHHATYRAVVLPDLRVITKGRMELLAGFVRAGGTLVAVGELPTIEPGGDDAGLAAVVAGLFGPGGSGRGRAVHVPGTFDDDPGAVDPSALDKYVPITAAIAAGIGRRAAVTPRPGTVLPRQPVGLPAVELAQHRRDGKPTYFLATFPVWRKRPPGWRGYGFEWVAETADVVLDVPAEGRPELWDAEHGRVHAIVHYDVDGDRLRIPLTVPGYGSALVVLQPGDPARGPRIVATNLGGAHLAEAGGRTVVRGWATGPEPPFAELVDGRDRRRLGADPRPPTETPAGAEWAFSISDADGSSTRTVGDWKLPQPGTVPPSLHPFSVGEATYTQTVDWRPGPPGRTWLELGQVFETATVVVNGVEAGRVLWPPYRVEVTDQLRAGSNEVTVKVRNTQANRWDHDMPSGLLGPVRFVHEQWVELR